MCRVVRTQSRYRIKVAENVTHSPLAKKERNSGGNIGANLLLLCAQQLFGTDQISSFSDRFSQLKIRRVASVRKSNVYLLFGVIFRVVESVEMNLECRQNLNKELLKMRMAPERK